MSDKKGLFEHPFVKEAVRLTAFGSTQSLGAKSPGDFKPVPLGLIAYSLTIVSTHMSFCRASAYDLYCQVHHVIDCYKTGEYVAAHLQVDTQGITFNKLFDLLEKKLDHTTAVVQQLQIDIFDHCM